MKNWIVKFIEKRPRTPISGNGRWLQARTQQIGGHWCQLRGWRWWGISVGWGFMQAGASCLKVCNFNRERASARTLCTPGICFALKLIFLSKHTSTSLCTKNIKFLSRHDCLLITWTKASLSVKKRILWFCMSCTINADLKQLGKALKGQCLNDTSYVAIGHNTIVYQRQHRNPRHQRHRYTLLAD